MAKTHEVKFNEAMERFAERMSRTDSEQLSLIKKRRGESLKEVSRLTANIARVLTMKKAGGTDKKILANKKSPVKKGKANGKG